jgi:hypothetical protein
VERGNYRVISMAFAMLSHFQDFNRKSVRLLSVVEGFVSNSTDTGQLSCPALSGCLAISLIDREYLYRIPSIQYRGRLYVAVT